MLKELTWTYVIEASSLAAQQRGQIQLIDDLFRTYNDAASTNSSWKIFPTYYRERLEVAGGDESERIRTCIDLIASMTESQVIAMHRRVTGQSHSSGLDEILR